VGKWAVQFCPLFHSFPAMKGDGDQITQYTRKLH
jgi:hypothetical protein